MKCPVCDSDDVWVVYSRPSKGYPWQIRRRECRNCGTRFTTSERIDHPPQPSQQDQVAT